MPGIVDQIERANAVIRDAERKGKAPASEAAKLASKRAKARDSIIQAQRRIREGESTGDPIRDIVVLFDADITQSAAYKKLARLNAALAAHPGELFAVIEGGERPQVIGVVPDDARIVPDISTLHSRPSITIVGARALVVNKYSPFSGAQLAPFYLSYPAIRNAGIQGPIRVSELNILVGTTAVNKWYSDLEGETAFSIWATSTRLPQPLDETAEVLRVIMNQREALLGKLIPAHAKLNQLQQKFTRWQRHPDFAFREGHPKHVPTEDGVSLDFGLTTEIARAVKLVSELVRDGILLQMQSNMDVQKAARDVGIEIEVS